MPNTTKIIVRAGLIAGLYVVLSLLTLPVASGAIQFRLSEALTILPLFFIEAVPALFVGCMLSNLITGCAIFDIVFGSLITLVAGFFTYLCSKAIKIIGLKIFVGGLFPVLLNALLLPVVWVYCYGALEYIYIIQSVILLVSQSVVIYLLGTPTYLGVRKMKENGIKFFM